MEISKIKINKYLKYEILKTVKNDLYKKNSLGEIAWR